jgi:hypothetical protein
MYKYMRKFMSIRNCNLISICHYEERIGVRSFCSFMSIHILQVKIRIAWEHSTADATTLLLVTTPVIFIHFIISFTYSEVYYTVYTLKSDRGAKSNFGRSGDRNPVGTRFSAPVQTGLGPIQPPVQWVPGLS